MSLWRDGLLGAGIGCCLAAAGMVLSGSPSDAGTRRFGWGLGLFGGVLLGLAIVL